ncbi:MAG: hypothetical protein KBC42_02505 [Candidatus Pacebacteria bacterium]|nr:hypothetical protein [Candidatus Paceibacterota bacterium]MBP9780773.1 hypothetical protein [Candidatus Paceibacterota bacterium]
MEIIEKFNKLFCELGELCFNIKMVERPLKPFDFTAKESQPANPDYLDEVLNKHPKTIRGFFMSIRRTQCDSIQCLLQENGEIIVEFYNRDMEVEKTISYTSVKDLSENKVSIIHFLTREWKPF